MNKLRIVFGKAVELAHSRQHLFVYGSLRPGYANEHVMTKIGGEWREATIKGKWFEEGWGYMNHGLRGMVVDAQGEEVPGFIFSSTNLKNYWATIDAFEGEDYERVETRAVCAGDAGSKLAVRKFQWLKSKGLL